MNGCRSSEAGSIPPIHGRHSHAWRLHLQFDVDHHVPSQWEVTDPRNTGRSDEKSVLRRELSPTPGRFGATLRLTLACTAATVPIMIHHIPHALVVMIVFVMAAF